ncbi:alpha/beta hydrolase [Candidatus Woesearchaeota archaeon]|nr:alpha/beta hydrolase [Candidatus Woesearchaeota archaeon]
MSAGKPIITKEGFLISGKKVFEDVLKPAQEVPTKRAEARKEIIKTEGFTKGGIKYLNYLSAEPKKEGLLFFHGFGVDRTDYAKDEFFEELASAGYPIYVFFSPGFAGSKGQRGYIDERTSKQRLEEAHNLAKEEGLSKTTDIFHSFATAEGAKYLTENDPTTLGVNSIIFIAPFTNLDETLENHPILKKMYALGRYMPRWMPAPYLFANAKYHSNRGPKVGAKKWVKARDVEFIKALNSKEYIPKLGVPKLYMIPDGDRIIPPLHQRNLASKNEKIINIPNSGHNAMNDQPQITATEILNWLSQSNYP